MSPIPELRPTEQRTRAFARVIGPFLFLTTAAALYRMPQMDRILADFFANSSLAWVTGAMLLLVGIIVIALHQHWRSPAAILISLLGWLVALRGAVLMLVPEFLLGVGEAAMRQTFAVQISFAVFALIGLYLTYVGWIARPRRSREADKG